MIRVSRQSPKPDPRELTAACLAIVMALWSFWLLSPESRLGTLLVRTSYDWSQALGNYAPLTNSPVVLIYLDLDSHLREKQSPVGANASAGLFGSEDGLLNKRILFCKSSAQSV